jgi:hypothetical protein
MSRIYYTRDDGGHRALWVKKPTKEDGDWTDIEDLEYTIIAADWGGGSECVDAIIGSGFHRLRKGGIMDIELSWQEVSDEHG